MKAVIDRLEGEYAVLLVGDQEFRIDLPKSLLPPGAKEGSWLTWSLKLDSAGEKAQREKISSLLDKLKKKGKNGK